MTVFEYEDNLLLAECLGKDIPPSKEEVNVVAHAVHFRAVLNLIYTFFVNRKIKSALKILSVGFVNNGITPKYVSGVEDVDLVKECEKLHIVYLNSKFSIKGEKVFRGISKDNMIAGGKVYTQSDIVDDIVKRTFAHIDISPKTKALDFACGTGRFYERLVALFTEHGVKVEDAVLDCIDAIDLDPVAVNVCRLKAFSKLTSIKLSHAGRIAMRIKWQNALIPDETESRTLFSSIESEEHYDAIVANPPYLVLKPSHKTSDQLAEEMKKQVQFFRTSGLYVYSLEGMLNLYQLSIERMMSMLKSNGELGVICPSTLFADKSASKLRKFLLNRNKVRHITYYPEKAVLFENNVTQATNIFILQKGGKTDSIYIRHDDEDFSVELSLVKSLFADNMEIPLISVKDWELLSHLNKYSKLKSFSEIRNRRGELDLTLGSRFITSERTEHRLIRGKMITSSGIVGADREFVTDDFFAGKSNDYLSKDCGKVRLVGQNISNIDNDCRLRFVFCEPNDVLGNSCNYISAALPVLQKLNILLSSRLLNWRFKVTSTNNHINNYELDELPIVDLEKVDEKKVFNCQDDLDEYVCKLYEVDFVEFKKMYNENL